MCQLLVGAACGRPIVDKTNCGQSPPLLPVQPRGQIRRSRYQLSCFASARHQRGDGRHFIVPQRPEVRSANNALNKRGEIGDLRHALPRMNPFRL